MPEQSQPNELLAALARELPSDDAVAQVQHGLTTLLQQDFDAAEPLFVTALAALRPDQAGCELASIALRECAAQRPEKLSSLRKRIMETPGWSDVGAIRVALAEAELSIGEPAVALTRAEQLLAGDPRDVRALRIATEALDRLDRPAEAVALAARWIAAETGSDALTAAIKQLDGLLSQHSEIKLPASLTLARVALLGNVTTNYLSNAMRAKALLESLYLRTYVGDFDQYRQELLDPASKLQAFQPDAVIVVLDWREVLPRLYLANLASDAAVLRAEIESETAQLAQVLRSFRTQSGAAVLVTGPVAPASSPLGFVDAGHEKSVAALFAHLERQLAEDVATIAGVYVQHADRLLSAPGQTACLSPKMHYLGRVPYTPLGMQTLARDFASFVRQAKGKARKCLVLDLDNTLWGGIIGEDGLEGIKLGHEGLGRAFADFQREVLRLHEQGVILAICSKNNEADALEVFEKHPDMVLKLEHFAALRINWLDKPANLRSLAAEINIGIDALVFLDDNPVERGAVRQLVPEVLVPDLPRDPVDYPDFVRSLTCFATLQLTDEDLKRGQFYAGERQRKTLQESAGNLDDYLRALSMTLHILPLDDFTRPRIVQLIHRTNQFNLTTRRHNEADVANMTPERGYYVCSIRLEDRYGDSGIVGVAILRLANDDPAFPGERVGVLDTLLMSCRILGRNVERAFLAYLIDFAAARGAQTVIGEFVPSAKNQMVADFYSKFGFQPMGALNSARRWSFDCTRDRLSRPDYISIRESRAAVSGTPE